MNTGQDNKTVLHSLETAVIDWAHQIKDVIKSDSATPLEQGHHVGPMVELDFWAAKAANLQCIYDQLNGAQIQKISQLLESSGSTYYPAFKNIFEEVVFGKGRCLHCFNCANSLCM
jgi:dynein heavy chain